MRYRPGEAIRWLSAGAEASRKSAQKQGKSLIKREGQRTIGKDVGQAAGALLDAGRGAIADLLHRQAEASEYLLHDEYFEVVKAGTPKRYDYADVKSIRLEGDRATLILTRGSLTISPYAHIVSGRIKAPIGWVRNGMEVPYELLVDEIAARCGIEVEEE